MAVVPPATMPMLLFDGECAVCRSIARWVKSAALNSAGAPSIIERPIGDNPDDLRALNPALDIWDAYATIHVLMPDGSMKLGGEAVAEVLRCVPALRWFAQLCSIGVAGICPLQLVLDAGYTILADVRPILGCESCGTSNAVVRFLAPRVAAARMLFQKRRESSAHFSMRPAPKSPH